MTKLMTVNSRARSAPQRSAAHTRERILHAARRHFSQHSYDRVGTRDIAAEAGVDAALVNRYFGGKERLFAEVITGGFRLEEQLPAQLSELGAHLVERVLREPSPASEEWNPLLVLLRAVGNPAIASLVSVRFHSEFIGPLAKLLRGRDAEARAALIASYLIGLASVRHGLQSNSLAGTARRKAAQLAAAAIQACVE